MLLVPLLNLFLGEIIEPCPAWVASGTSSAVEHCTDDEITMELGRGEDGSTYLMSVCIDMVDSPLLVSKSFVVYVSVGDSDEQWRCRSQWPSTVYFS